MRKITVHTKPACVQCDWTKRELKKAGHEFGEVSLLDDPVKLAEFKAAGYLAAPVVVVEDGETTTIWAGFIPDKIAALAAQHEECAA